ncbi:unnamed protein product, partial [Larinioides sclopetarius]
MPIAEKRSATDGVVVPFKKPRTELIPGIDSHEDPMKWKIFIGPVSDIRKHCV